MAYSTVAQIQSEFKDLTISTTTSIKTADVERFIEEADAEIDSKVGLKYTVPITSGGALLLCRLISIAIVASRMREILKVKTGDPKLDQDNTSGMNVRAARKLLQDIVDGKTKFSGATLLTSSADGVKSFVGANNTKRNFNSGTDEW